MYGYPQYHPSIPNYYGFYTPYPIYRTYPPVDTKVFSSSVKHFRLLMEQGSILLNKLAETSFETKMMNAAQQGKQAEVDQLIKSIGLKVPVTTHYTPSGIKFILALPAAPGSFGSCCNLTVSMKWGN
ncbi:hypothetical protein HHO41_05090 [Bacillus sp. DNRA2]|uniref:hypothetical protein n=1 Tax=Bacillus sp. DNRA2 TaxID=2723053 RepID=UPI00145F8B0E|nr:hypothetical protein [Bacillus sp. DNRA2]NMD69654.1 hypothetical protein [Bacillus sp. DNRA2]